MRPAWMLTLAVMSLTLAGCVGEPEATPTDQQADETPTPVRVPVTAAHIVDGAGRSLAVTVTQGGSTLESATYDTTGRAADAVETLFDVEATGPLTLEVREGANTEGTKTIDPHACQDPDFQLHITNDAVHLWSNCD